MVIQSKEDEIVIKGEGKEKTKEMICFRTAEHDGNPESGNQFTVLNTS